jgi:hypothetical protein
MEVGQGPNWGCSAKEKESQVVWGSGDITPSFLTSAQQYFQKAEFAV